MQNNSYVSSLQRTVLYKGTIIAFKTILYLKIVFKYSTIIVLLLDIFVSQNVKRKHDLLSQVLKYEQRDAYFAI